MAILLVVHSSWRDLEDYGGNSERMRAEGGRAKVCEGLPLTTLLKRPVTRPLPHPATAVTPSQKIHLHEHGHQYPSRVWLERSVAGACPAAYYPGWVSVKLNGPTDGCRRRALTLSSMSRRPT